MYMEWLTDRCESIDLQEILLDRERSGKTHDWVEKKWNPFVACLLPGDELWRFNSPIETWATTAGRAGYAIVRDGQIVKTVVTRMN